MYVMYPSRYQDTIATQRDRLTFVNLCRCQVHVVNSQLVQTIGQSFHNRRHIDGVAMAMFTRLQRRLVDAYAAFIVLACIAAESVHPAELCKQQ